MYEASITQLLKEIEIIQQKNDREETHEELLQKQKNFYRDILKDFIAVFDKYEQKVTAMYTEMGVKEEAHHIEMKAIMQAEIQEERQARMQAEMEAKQARMEAKQARMEAKQARMQAEMQAKQAEMQAKVQEEIQARMENLERLLMASMALPQNQATASDASDNETAAATGYSFFPAGR